MAKYSVILSPNVSPDTKIKVWELCKDGVSNLESFISEVEDNGTYINDLYGAITNLELAANLVLLPKQKFREIRNDKIDFKLFEAKYGAVRIYHFHEKHTGRIIVLGGLKNDQEGDIKLAIKTIKEYLNEK